MIKKIRSKANFDNNIINLYINHSFDLLNALSRNVFDKLNTYKLIMSLSKLNYLVQRKFIVFQYLFFFVEQTNSVSTFL